MLKSKVNLIFLKLSKIYPKPKSELKYINNVAGYVNENNEQINNYFYNLFDTEIDPETKIYNASYSS